jgi:hypothetical protein
MPRDSRQKWTKFHLRAAHAHLAPTQHGKQDHQAGDEQSQQALEHAAKASSESQKARPKSANHGGETNRPPGEKSCSV